MEGYGRHRLIRVRGRPKGALLAMCPTSSTPAWDVHETPWGSFAGGGMSRKPRGFWKRPETREVIERYLRNEITLEAAAYVLGVANDPRRKSSPEAVIRWYAREYRKTHGPVVSAQVKAKPASELSPDQPAEAWTFRPVYPGAYATIRPRVFIVGPEPNEEGVRPGQPGRDMGLWFRTAWKCNYWGNPKFFRGALLQLCAVLGKPVETADRAEGDLSILKHLRYIDLKAVGGGASVRMSQVIVEWVIGHIGEIVGYWVKDRPDVTVLQGDHTQWAFEKIVAPVLRDEQVDVQRVGLPHPSQGGYNLNALKEVHEYLRPLSKPLFRWAPRKKKWEELFRR